MDFRYSPDLALARGFLGDFDGTDESAHTRKGDGVVLCENGLFGVRDPSGPSRGGDVGSAAGAGARNGPGRSGLL